MSEQAREITENEITLARTYAVRHILANMAASMILVALGWPVENFVWGDHAPAIWWQSTLTYLAALVIDWELVWTQYGLWWDFSMIERGVPPPAMVLAVIFFVLRIIVALRRNPYRFVDTTHGKARVAVLRDLVADKLFDQTGIVLGRWGDTHQLIRNWETTSAILIAPPGTAKTVQLISNLLADWPDRVRDWFRPFASLARLLAIKLSARLQELRLPFKTWQNAPVPAPCVVVNDPKSEMYKVTAGWRSRQGPVIRLSWGDPRNSARWNYMSPKSYKGGEECVALRARLLAQLGAIYDDPSDALVQILVLVRDHTLWKSMLFDEPAGVGSLRTEAGDARKLLEKLAQDFLDLQQLMAEREKHIDRGCAIIIPDSIEAHWRNTGREFLAGAMGFFMARCERLGIEPNFGGLLDWLNGATNGMATAREFEMVDTGEVDSKGNPIRVAKAPSGLQAGGAPAGEGEQDLTAKLLDEAIAEADAYGYPPRVRQDLVATRMKPDKERGSVISTAGAGLAIFKNASVRAVTSTSTFPLSAGRGMRTKDGDLRPVTFYIVISLEDAEFLGRITGLFLETLAAYAISQDESEFKTPWTKKGKLLGRPLLFILDEFWTLPALQSVLQIPALGRGQWVSMILVGQSYGQVGAKYRSSGGSDTVDTLKAATNYKIIPTQNDYKTAQEISQTIGNRTITTQSTSRQGFDLGALFDPNGGKGGVNISEQKQGVPLFRPEDIMSMEKLDPTKKQFGWQIVQLAGRMNRPLYVRPSCWFIHPVLEPRAGLEVTDWEPANSNEPEMAQPAAANGNGPAAAVKRPTAGGDADGGQGAGRRHAGEMEAGGVIARLMNEGR